MTSTEVLADLYLRLSDGRTENGSFTEREAALRRGAAVRGWIVRNVVVENDMPGMGKSASAFKRRKVTLPDGTKAMRVVRPGFRGILADLTAGRIQALLAEDLDRILRDPRDGEDLIDVVRATKANVDSASGSLRLTDGGTDAEITQARVLIAFAWKASSDTARRVTAGRKRTADAGRWAGGRRPFGFTPVPDPSGNHQNSKLEINEAEAVEIRKAATQVLEKISLRSIARDMNLRGIASVTGARWTPETLRDVLLRALNAGIVVYQGKETEVRLPGKPILHEDTWRGVVAKLTDPARATPGRAPCWLLTGIARCVCGAPMEIQRGKGRTPVYRCSEPVKDKEHVRGNAAAVDAYVELNVFTRLSEHAPALMAKAAPEVDVTGLRRQEQALTATKANLARKLGAGEIDDVEFSAARKANQAKLDKIQRTLAEATHRSPVGSLLGERDIEQKWETMSLGQRRAIINEIMTVRIVKAVPRSGYRGYVFDPGAVEII